MTRKEIFALVTMTAFRPPGSLIILSKTRSIPRLGVIIDWLIDWLIDYNWMFGERLFLSQGDCISAQANWFRATESVREKGQGGNNVPEHNSPYLQDISYEASIKLSWSRSQYPHPRQRMDSGALGREYSTKYGAWKPPDIQSKS